MGKVFNHPLRAMGAALTLAGAAIVFVVLILPALATAGPSPHPKPLDGGKGSPGKGEVWWYENDKGNVITKVGPDQEFTVVGKDLNFTRDRDWGVLCWNGKYWTEVSNWSYDTSRTLIDVDVNNDCSGMDTRIQVDFDRPGTPDDSSDDTFANGPVLRVKAA